MLSLFLNIISRSLKLDKSLYGNKKLFGEIGIYFANILILITSIISIIPNEVVLNWMSLNFNLGMIGPNMTKKLQKKTIPSILRSILDQN